VSIIQNFLPEASRYSPEVRDFVDEILTRLDPDEALTALRYAMVEDALLYDRLEAELSSYLN
jgi:hypothetical protein